ncbi:MAG: HAD hydrolase-like protein [Alphaproteobacteria bacterium]|nr:HAD hydrolase-like protein [Alphaproteobacteria bacterium]
MLTTKDLQYVLFDWDGTLAMTREAIVYAVEKVLVKYNLPNWESSRLKRDRNLSFRDNFPNVFGENLANQAYDDYKIEYEKNVSQFIRKPVGIDELLKKLQEKNITLMIMTNKDRNLFELEYNSLYPQGVFEKIVCGHEAKRDKPFPEHGWHTLAGYLTPQEISSEKVWVVGDTHQDLECALNINALPILVGKPIWGENIDKKDVLHFSSFETFLEAFPFDFV